MHRMSMSNHEQAPLLCPAAPEQVVTFRSGTIGESLARPL